MRNPLARSGERRAGPTAFVLYLGLSGVGAVRSLGRAGVPVVGLDSNPRRPGFASRYCIAKQCPHPVWEQEQLCEFLLAEGRQLDEPGILSPASDAFLLFVSRYRDTLAEHFRFNLPSPEVVETSINKRTLYELAEKAGVGSPKTFYPETMADVHRVKDELDYPAFIKPHYSHLWEEAKFTGKGIKVSNAEELLAGFERVFAAKIEALVQSIMLGPVTNIQSVSVYVTAAGETLGVFTNRKIRQYPSEFGMATMAESWRDRKLEETGLKFFHGIDYRGFGSIEFKKDDRDGVLKVTDLDLRWSKFVNLPPDSGMNFPLIHYLDLAGETPELQMEYQEGVRWLDAIGDAASAYTLVRTGELSPLGWGRSWAGVRSFTTFALDDPGPFLKEYRYGRRLARAPVQLWRTRRILPT